MYSGSMLSGRAWATLPSLGACSRATDLYTAALHPCPMAAPWEHTGPWWFLLWVCALQPSANDNTTFHAWRIWICLMALGRCSHSSCSLAGCTGSPSACGSTRTRTPFRSLPSCRLRRCLGTSLGSRRTDMAVSWSPATDAHSCTCSNHGWLSCLWDRKSTWSSRAWTLVGSKLSPSPPDWA